MAGWRSDTYLLQRNGWEISADQRMDTRTLQIALHHRASGIYCMSQVEDLDYFNMDRAEMLARMSIRVNQISSHATPHVIQWTESSLDQLVVFRPLPTNEIIVKPDTVPGLMDKILALQDPNIKKLMESQRKRDARDNLDAPPVKISNRCQIISIAS